MAHADNLALAELVDEVRKAAQSLEAGESKTNQRIDHQAKSIDGILVRLNRPGGEHYANDNVDKRKSATEWCIVKHQLSSPKSADEYTPSPSEIETAMLAAKGLDRLFRGDASNIEPTIKKALSSFNLGSNGFILPQEMSSTVLTCIVDPTDIAGLMGNVTTSAGSLKFFIDNARMQDSVWACEASCFANNPQGDLSDGLGELEIKCETLRHVVCAGSDLLADAGFPIQNWVLGKVQQGFRNTINNAVTVGDGLGKPLGILNPQSGIPILTASENTPPGTFTWQDLIQLKWNLPVQYHGPDSAYLMNQKTFALCLTMSDALGRPLMIDNPTQGGQFLLNGSPIVIASQFPDVAPGACPVAFGDWKNAYMVVTRNATSMLVDPYSAGWCTLMKFEARVGGAPTCPNAARLLRVQ